MTINIDTDIERARLELWALRNKGRKNRFNQKRDEEELRWVQGKHLKTEELLLEKAKKDLDNLYVYAQYLKGDNDGVPTLVMDLQALLCRSLHQEANLHNHSILVNTHYHEEIKQARKKITCPSDEAIFIEMQLLNKMNSLNNDVEFLRDNCSKQIVRCKYDDVDEYENYSIAHSEDEISDDADMDFIVSTLVRDTESRRSFTCEDHRKIYSADSYGTAETVDSSSLSGTQELEEARLFLPLNRYEHANALIIM